MRRPNQEQGIYEAYKLGLGDPIIFSAEHNIGFDELYLGLKELEEKLAADADKSAGRAGYIAAEAGESAGRAEGPTEERVPAGKAGEENESDMDEDKTQSLEKTPHSSGNCRATECRKVNACQCASG